jgi:hypothetical protein
MEKPIGQFCFMGFFVFLVVFGVGLLLLKNNLFFCLDAKETKDQA